MSHPPAPAAAPAAGVAAAPPSVTAAEASTAGAGVEKASEVLPHKNPGGREEGSEKKGKENEMPKEKKEKTPQLLAWDTKVDGRMGAQTRRHSNVTARRLVAPYAVMPRGKRLIDKTGFSQTRRKASRSN